MSLGEKAKLDITSDFAYLGCERQKPKRSPAGSTSIVENYKQIDVGRIW